VNLPLEQANALIALRAKLWWRRLVQGRQWVRIAVGAVAALLGVMFSFSLCLVIFDATHRIRQAPEALRDLGGPLSVFASWVTLALAGRGGG